uniref:soluble epoxide hydrolase n=2 Tax=Chenopodium quinoa TaxID=63459 RepID=A0A803LS81_CHEQI
MAEISGIKHRTIHVNGINMHIAEKGDEGAPIVLFIHGFPELWYTWRHQIEGISAMGYRAVAPDMRGYGDTDAPTDARSYTYGHLVGDLIGLIDELKAEKVFVVSHDWGAVVAWWLCLFRPDRVKAAVNMSVPFAPRNPKMKPIDMLRAGYGDDYYICRFQVPGEIEGEITEAGGADKLLKKVFAYRNPAQFMLPKGQSAFSEVPPFPNWLSEADAAYYCDTFSRTGFTGGLNYYRALNLNWEITAPWTRAQVKVPVKFIVGDLDLTYNAPGVKDYIHKGGMKRDVPLLEDVVVLQGVGHFLQEEQPDVITKHIYDFINKF